MRTACDRESGSVWRGLSLFFILFILLFGMQGLADEPSSPAVETSATTNELLQAETSVMTNEPLQNAVESEPGPGDDTEYVPERLDQGSAWDVSPPAHSWFDRIGSREDAIARFDVGVRSLYLKLKRNRRGEPFDDSFIGSIDKLEAVQDHTPNRFFLQCAFFDTLGIGFQWDRLEARTLTTLPREQRAGDRNTDGDVVLRGGLPYLFVRLPNRTHWTPFFELGRATYRTTFNANQEWFADGLRNFVLDPTVRADYWWAGGVEFEIADWFQLDTYYRVVDVDVSGEYIFLGDGRAPAPFVFTMKHAVYGLGAKYRF